MPDDLRLSSGLPSPPGSSLSRSGPGQPFEETWNKYLSANQAKKSQAANKATPCSSTHSHSSFGSNTLTEPWSPPICPVSPTYGLTPTAPGVPQLRVSVPRSFARDQSSTSNSISRTSGVSSTEITPGPGVTFGTQQGLFSERVHERASLTPSSSATPTSLDLEDALAALKRYTNSSSGDVTSKTVQQRDYSALTTRFTLEKELDILRTPPMAGELAQSEISGRYLPPHRRHESVGEVSSPWCPGLATPAQKMSAMPGFHDEPARVKVPFAPAPPQAGWPHKAVGAQMDKRNISYQDKENKPDPAKKSLFASKLAGPDLSPGVKAPRSLVPTFVKPPPAWGTGSPQPKPGQEKKLPPIPEDVITNPNIEAAKLLNLARPKCPDTEKPPGPPVERIATLCHVLHSQKKPIEEVPQDVVKSLVKMQIKAPKPIRAPWYRDEPPPPPLPQCYALGGPVNDQSSNAATTAGTGFFFPAAMNYRR